MSSPTLQPQEQQATDERTVDADTAVEAASTMLTALGVDVTSESTKDTPGRMVKALTELISPQPFTLTTFPNEEQYHELLVQDQITFVSLCEHHGLPFLGAATVGYLPKDRIVGLSKLARAVRHLAARPQVQERLTKQIATLLQNGLDAAGVGVAIRAEHLCMTIRGVQAPGTYTVTSSMTGQILTDERTRAEFLTVAGSKQRG